MTCSAAVPANEGERLARLHALAVLDSAPEALFDSLARVAAEVCGVPIALVSLTDADRQWFKARVGVVNATQSPRDLAFCAHVLLGSEVMEVCDARLDPRFADNPLITGGPQLRFYAGAPITLSDGLTMGTLCVFDRQPRRLEAHQRAILLLLGRAAAQALEMRERALNELKRAARSRERLDNLHDSVPAMLHSIDAQGRLLTVSEVWLATLGYRRDEVIGRPSTDFMTPESAAHAKNVVMPEFYRVGRCDRLEYQFVRKDGSIIDVLLSAVLERDETGAAVGTLSIIEDVTARKRAERELSTSEARYRALVQDQRELVSLSDREGRLSFVNGAYAQHFGKSPQALIGASLFNHMCEKDRAAVSERLHRVFDQGVIDEGESRSIGSDGKARWLAWSNRPLTDEHGRITGIHSVGRDITQRKEAERQLAENRELLEVTLESIGDAVITTDAQGRVQWLNPVGERLTGWPRAEAQGRLLAQVFTAFCETHRAANRRTAHNPVARCLWQRRAVDRSHDTVLVSRDGTEYGITDSASPILDPQGQPLGAVLVFHDATEQRRMSREIAHRARHDALTGLANRAEFESRLTRLLARSREDGSDNALLYIDLDQFKLVNDACGHPAGDLLLRQASALLQACVRGRDTVARLGGDEFGVLLEHCGVGDAQRVAQSMCNRMEEFRFVHEGRRFRVGTSIGLVPLRGHTATTPAAAMQAADTSCYAAKEGGRNRVHTWFDTDQAMRTRHGEMQWASRIEQALDDNRFELFAQRIAPISPAAGQAERLHCELLLRLREPDGTLVPPGAFLPAAERFHMASRIDRWVLRRALAWMTAMAAEAGRIELVAINLSGQSMGDAAFRRDVAEWLRDAAFDRSKLCFEITETAAITNFAEARIFVEDMRALGVKIALDDFGAGASSFGYLKTLPVDFLKIDGQFITDLLEDPLDNAAVRCFCEVARVVGVKTIAEFVERADVLEALRQIGVDYAQGYLVHRPQPLGELFHLAPVSALA